MIIFLYVALVLKASQAQDDEPKFNCYHTRDLKFNPNNATTHRNCQNCVLEETFSAYKLIAANRQCVGKTCQPFRRVYNGNGQNRYCCTSRLCNVDRETAEKCHT
ncbi:hypothetical protein CSKR_108696 [Clonorchis sinensis]|uniref:UPAR/Ly6 domain-containing protein n=1 Tax=Clonorchis sinensis TaxID=79923 RepID=A0A8T1MYF5_CLOSI|nr:hypothetical protein CSKR_108696 [Clonorchis sinensis]